MTDASRLPDSLIRQAMAAARNFAVGEVEPRVVPNASGEWLHRETQADGSSPPASYLLLDVGWPRAFVRFRVEEGAGGILSLSEPVLWPYQLPHSEHTGAQAQGYVPLFQEWRETLNQYISPN